MFLHVHWATCLSSYLLELRTIFSFRDDHISALWWKLSHKKTFTSFVSRYLFCVVTRLLVSNVHESHLLLFLYLPTNSYDTHYDNNFLCSFTFSSPRFSFLIWKDIKLCSRLICLLRNTFQVKPIWTIFDLSTSKWFFNS